MKSLIKKIQSIVADNRVTFMWILLFFLIGIVIGSYSVYYMSDIGKVEMGKYLNNFLVYVKGNDIEYLNLLLNSIKSNLPGVILIILFGLTIAGFPFVLLINLLKGYILGFTLSLVITVLGVEGTGVIITTLIIQNIIFVPVVILISILSMRFSILKVRGLKKETNRNTNKFSEYIALQGVLVAILVFGIIIETYISPNLARLVIS
ncbi:MAG: stage II sporulation protein M [Sarcina sp.]